MRTINDIIIHCTATPAWMPVSVQDIDAWHREMGFDEIGYHFVVTQDGTIYKGRDFNKIGAHCSGHNRGSIGIAYCGGIDETGQPADTRSEAQKVALKALADGLAIVFGASIHGHNQYNQDKACPCFNVQTDL